MSEIGLFVVAILISLVLAVVFGCVLCRISKRCPPLRDDDVEMAEFLRGLNHSRDRKVS